MADPAVAARAALVAPFEHHGYRIMEAGAVEQALTLFDERFCDVVVTELSVDSFIGVELIRGIRARLSGGYPTIVALTTLPAISLAIDEARTAGCDLVLCKPVLPWVFVQSVDQLVRQNRELRILTRGGFEGV